jgi:hypothetical protein
MGQDLEDKSRSELCVRIRRQDREIEDFREKLRVAVAAAVRRPDPAMIIEVWHEDAETSVFHAFERSADGIKFLAVIGECVYDGEEMVYHPASAPAEETSES